MMRPQLLLQLLVSPELHAMAYQEDVARLAETSRVPLEPCVEESLARSRHIVGEYDDWHFEECVMKSAAMDISETVISEYDLCLSCGMRPGVAWLGHTECMECFDDH